MDRGVLLRVARGHAAHRDLVLVQQLIVVHKGHLATRRKLALQAEMFDRHALEEALAGIGATPRYRTTVPHPLANPALLRDCDMLSIRPPILS